MVSFARINSKQDKAITPISRTTSNQLLSFLKMKTRVAREINRIENGIKGNPL
jgi:hypothetical protein